MSKRNEPVEPNDDIEPDEEVPSDYRPTRGVLAQDDQEEAQRTDEEDVDTSDD